MTIRIEEIAAPDTYDLRRRVLRAGDPAAEVAWPDDDLDGTIHLGARTPAGSIVGISTWIVRGHEVQLRGMATEPSRRGDGIGRDLLDAGLARARDAGAVRVWANARISAIGFYERAGFVASGPEFVPPPTGVPHRLVTLDLA